MLNWVAGGRGPCSAPSVRGGRRHMASCMLASVGYFSGLGTLEADAPMWSPLCAGQLAPCAIGREPPRVLLVR